MTVKHSVLWRLKRRGDASLCKEFWHGIEAGRERFPGLLNFRAGPILMVDGSFDFALEAEFESWDSLKLYMENSAHRKMVSEFAGFVETKTIVDFEWLPPN